MSVRYKRPTVHYWLPQEGPQAEATICPVDELFFGGTRGGGKSDTVIGRQVRGASAHGYKWNGLVVRRKYKDLAVFRRRVDELIREGMPAERIGSDTQTNYVRFANGALITLAGILTLAHADDHQGQQYTEISIDEAPTIPFIGALVDRLKGCLRSPHGVPCHMVLTGNPGGPGASQVKLMFIDPVPEGQVNHITQHLEDGTTYTFTRVFIRSVLRDNRVLMESDPGYERRLASIADTRLRAAWLKGDWGITIGQAFDFYPDVHVLPKHLAPWPIPPHAPVYMTFDWGYGAPFSVGWWWVDEDERLYRFAEWYGWNGVTPNVGLRLTDEGIAKGIMEREKAMGIGDRRITRLAGPDCWNKKPDYRGGGQGPSTASVWRDKYGLELRKGDPNRELKIRQFRSRLAVPDEYEHDPTMLPMLLVYPSCTHFIRIIPALVVDESTGEYLEDGQELHPFDDACHICMARPVGLSHEDLRRMERTQARQDALSRLDSASRAAAEDYARTLRQVENMENGGGDFDDDESLFFGVM